MPCQLGSALRTSVWTLNITLQRFVLVLSGPYLSFTMIIPALSPLSQSSLPLCAWPADGGHCTERRRVRADNCRADGASSRLRRKWQRLARQAPCTADGSRPGQRRRQPGIPPHDRGAPTAVAAALRRRGVPPAAKKERAPRPAAADQCVGVIICASDPPRITRHTGLALLRSVLAQNPAFIIMAGSL